MTNESLLNDITSVILILRGKYKVSEEKATEATYRAFARVWDKDYDPQAFFEYLRVSAKNELLRMFYREEKYPMDEAVDLSKSLVHDPKYTGYDLSELDRIAEQLPDVYRELFELLRQGIDQREIANRLNKSYGAVRVMKSRMIQYCQAVLVALLLCFTLPLQAQDTLDVSGKVVVGQDSSFFDLQFPRSVAADTMWEHDTTRTVVRNDLPVLRNVRWQSRREAGEPYNYFDIQGESTADSLTFTWRGEEVKKKTLFPDSTFTVTVKTQYLGEASYELTGYDSLWTITNNNIINTAYLDTLGGQESILNMALVDLFSSSEAGALFINDKSTMWQDTAGTVAVTADGDPVARWDDQSGNGNHLTQPNSANRPVYRESGGIAWVDFNGTSHYLANNSMTITQPMEWGIAQYMRDLSRDQRWIDHGGSGDRSLLGLDSGFDRFALWSGSNTRFTSVDSALQDTNQVVQINWDSGLADVWIDDVNTNNDLTTGSNGQNGLWIGTNESGSPTLWYDGRIYGLFLIDRNLTSQERSDSYDDLVALYTASGGGGTTEVSFSLNSAANVSSSSTSIAEAGISLNADADVSDGSTATGESSLTVSHIQQASTQSTAQAESAMSLSNLLQIAFSKQSVTDAAFSLPTVHQVTTVSDTQETSEASFSLALQKSITTQQISTIEVSYSLNATQQAAMASDATGEAAMSMTLQAGLSLVSTALAEAGISFDAVQSMTITGQAVGVEVTLSDGRTLTIKLQNRTLPIASQDRTLTISPDNRTLSIDP